ncbi:MAG: hypothetical protein Q9160_008711 [Pyrenula sp. 1 TL-2023]
MDLVQSPEPPAHQCPIPEFSRLDIHQSSNNPCFIHRIPQELKDDILEYLTKKDIKSMRLVQKVFVDFGIQKIFTNICTPRELSSGSFQGGFKLLNRLRSNQLFRSCVLSITLNAFPKTPIDPSQYVMPFSNLQNITFDMRALIHAIHQNLVATKDGVFDDSLRGALAGRRRVNVCFRLDNLCPREPLLKLRTWPVFKTVTEFQIGISGRFEQWGLRDRDRVANFPHTLPNLRKYVVLSGSDSEAFELLLNSRIWLQIHQMEVHQPRLEYPKPIGRYVISFVRARRAILRELRVTKAITSNRQAESEVDAISRLIEQLSCELVSSEFIRFFSRWFDPGQTDSKERVVACCDKYYAASYLPDCCTLDKEFQWLFRRGIQPYTSPQDLDVHSAQGSDDVYWRGRGLVETREPSVWHRTSTLTISLDIRRVELSEYAQALDEIAVGGNFGNEGAVISFDMLPLHIAKSQCLRGWA